MIITDTTPERNMANIFNAIDTLKHYISLWGDNEVRRELERVLHKIIIQSKLSAGPIQREEGCCTNYGR